MTQKVRLEFIIMQENAWQSWVRDAGTFALFVGLIGTGVFLESTVMQWAGFFVAVTTIIAKASRVKKMNREEAIDYLTNKID